MSHEQIILLLAGVCLAVMGWVARRVTGNLDKLERSVKEHFIELDKIVVRSGHKVDLLEQRLVAIEHTLETFEALAIKGAEKTGWVDAELQSLHRGHEHLGQSIRGLAFAKGIGNGGGSGEKSPVYRPGE